MERIVIAASAIAVAGLVLTALSATALGSARAAAKWPSAQRPRLGTGAARVGVALGVLLCAAAAALAVSLVPVRDMWILWGLMAGAALLAAAHAAWAAVKLASKIELSALINSPSPLRGQLQTAMAVAVTQPPTIVGPPTHFDPNDIAYGKPYPGMVTAAPPPSSPPVVTTSADGFHTTTPGIAPFATQTPIPDVATDDSDDPSVPSTALPGWVYTDVEGNWYLVTSIPQGRRMLLLSDFSIVPVGEVIGELTLAGSIEMTVWPANIDEADDSDTQEHPIVRADAAEADQTDTDQTEADRDEATTPDQGRAEAP